MTQQGGTRSGGDIGGRIMNAHLNVSDKACLEPNYRSGIYSALSETAVKVNVLTC